MEWQQLMGLSHLTLLWNDNYLEYDESLTSHKDQLVGLIEFDFSAHRLREVT